jgi:hypothetical protein
MFDLIPIGLRTLPQFLVWKAEQRDGRWTKVPYNSRGGPGSSTNSQTWSSFDEAKQAYECGNYSGIGIAMSAPLAGVDLDGCVDPNTAEIADWAMVIIRAFNSYAEISPSGKGVRIFFKGELPGPGLNRTVRGCHVEIYDKGRFLTITGHQIVSTPDTIEPRQEAASQLYQWILDHTAISKQSGARPVIDPNQKGKDLTDSEVMDCAMNAANGAKFEKLWDGDISDYADATHPDGNPSRADAAMVGLLCYHSLDNEQVARLWKASGLFRQKLDREDYIERTIEFIRKSQTGACAKTLLKKKAATIKLNRVAIPRIASEFDDVVLLVLAEYEPVVSEEDKLTLIALISIFSGRKTAPVSRGLLARRIRRLDDSGAVASSKTLDQFGGRRLTALRQALRRAIKVPVLTMTEHSRKRGFDKRTQKPKASRYSLDLSIFTEALSLAHFYYDEWCDGKPRFKEWQGDGNYQPKPNPGKCREVAARQVARKYSKLVDEEKPDGSEVSRPKPDDFSKWVGSEYTMYRAAGKWADALERLDKTANERRQHASRLLERIKGILLQDFKLERRRMLLKLLQDSGNGSGEASFTHEGKLSEDNRAVKNGENDPSCSHNSVNTNGDTSVSLYARQLEQWRALGQISEDSPRPAIWHNKDYDESKTVIGVFDEPGADGKLYVKTLEGAGGLSFDELEFLPSILTENISDEFFDTAERF